MQRNQRTTAVAAASGNPPHGPAVLRGGSLEAIMRPAFCALVGALIVAGGAAPASASGRESYFSKQLAVQQQQLDLPRDPGLEPGQILVITPRPYTPPPPPFRLHVAP